MEASVLGHPIFRGADAELALSVLDGVRPRWFPRGALLAAPGTGPRAVFLVLEGQLRSYLLTPDGRRVILELVGPGGLDGLLPTIGLTGHFTEAAERTLAASISPVQLDRLVRADPTVAVNLVTLATRRLAVRENQLEALAVRDPGRRIAAQLLSLARNAGSPDAARNLVDLRHGLTHQVIADMTGIRRETVTLHLQRLTDCGAVEPRGPHMTVNSELLAQIVAGTVRLAARRGRRPERRPASVQ